MGKLLQHRWTSTVGIVAASALPPLALLLFPHEADEQFTQLGFADACFLISIGAALAAAAGVTLTIAGVRRRDGRTVLVGTAFSVMATLLMVHALAIGDQPAPESGLGMVTGALVLPVGGALLALSALPSARAPRDFGALVRFQVILVAAIAAFGVIGLVLPEAIPAIPRPGESAALALLATGLVLYGALIERVARTFALTHRVSDALVVAGTVWLAVALFQPLLLDPGSWGWWLGHLLELAGIGLIGTSVAYDLRRAAQSRPLAGDFRGTELVAYGEAFLGAQARALLVRLAEKDAYTEGHTRRVAMSAVQVGEAMGLGPSRLRDLAIGGLLHDMGKLSVPSSILQKPGSLTNEEFDVIRRHPEWGVQILERLGGFSREVIRLVRDHHERLDGGGYPNGVSGDGLDLETRILTVCDVYDALRSTRVYREAWTQERALDLLERESGSAFDPACVAALRWTISEAPGRARRTRPSARREPRRPAGARVGPAPVPALERS